MNEADLILTQLIRDHKTPSVQYAVFNREHVIRQFHSGFSDIALRTRATEKTLYNGYSVTKTFCAGGDATGGTTQD
jgi:CubicO group peptidase (beta-lactamase class C family)